jgi:hypothetical protein
VRPRLGLVALLAALACGHPIEGALEPGPLPEPDRLLAAPDLAFAALDGERPGFLLIQPFVHEGRLYLLAGTILSGDVPWLDRLVHEGSLRVLANGKVFAARAVHLASPAEIDPLLPTVVERLYRMDAAGLHFLPASDRYPGTQLRQWYFRVEPEPGRLSSLAGATGDPA